MCNVHPFFQTVFLTFLVFALLKFRRRRLKSLLAGLSFVLGPLVVLLMLSESLCENFHRNVSRSIPWLSHIHSWVLDIIFKNNLMILIILKTMPKNRSANFGELDGRIGPSRR